MLDKEGFMRSNQEMMDLVLGFANRDERIRIVGMEGSRVNDKVKSDELQDYDVTYIVTDMKSFLKDDIWLEYFGNRIFMQKPEVMTLFPPSLGNWFSYLMLFEDGNRIDLKIVPISEYKLYLSSDKLIRILLDKDNLISDYPIPTDIDYCVKIPTKEEFDDCCNEFWWVSTYVAKGLCRREILYAIDHLNNHVRPNLLLMISWDVGLDTSHQISVGKNYKYLEHYIPKNIWDKLLKTYRLDSYDNLWDSLSQTFELFREYSKKIALKLQYNYPDYDDKITKYINGLYIKYFKK